MLSHWKKTAIGLIAVREPGVSRHYGAQLCSHDTERRQSLSISNWSRLTIMGLNWAFFNFFFSGIPLREYINANWYWFQLSSQHFSNILCFKTSALLRQFVWTNYWEYKSFDIFNWKFPANWLERLNVFWLVRTFVQSNKLCIENDLFKPVIAILASWPFLTLFLARIINC